MKIKEIPSEPEYLIKKGTTDLSRILKINPDEIFNAYFEIIHSIKSDIKDFRNLYSALDFIYLREKQIFKSNEKQINFTHKDQLRINELVHKLEMLIIEKIKYIEKTTNNYQKDPIYIFLTNSHSVYYELTQIKSNTTKIINEFIKPFGETLRNKFDKEDFFVDFLSLVSRSIILFEHLSMNNIRFADELIGVRKEMTKSINTINTIKEIINCHNEE